uniref:NADH-ubiquinone oxidoreductase chain 6 n=1 Tax=Machla sappho TaxID=2841781 RepID=A0A8F3FM18_9CUCU|nr:NADH dehydrogenase subunit 6 [Machla sappho]
MMTMLFTVNMLLSLIFLSLSHPLSMGLILFMQTLIVSLITGNFTYNFWFSYIIFLILIGGMLILFMYMTSIASNEKFSFNIKSLALMTISLLTLTIPMIKINMNYLNNEIKSFESAMIINQSLNKFINHPSNLMLMFVIMYLLLTMIATVKITDFKKGPIRQMN